MWFWWSLRQLPRFDAIRWGPFLAAPLFFALFEGAGGRVFGIEIFALKTALLTTWMISACFYAWRALTLRREAEVASALYILLFGSALLMPSEQSLMLFAVGFHVAQTALVGLIPVIFNPEEYPRLPYRWLRVEETFAAGHTLLLVREIAAVTVSYWVALQLSPLDWLLWISVGRIALYYLYEWLMTLLFATGYGR